MRALTMGLLLAVACGRQSALPERPPHAAIPTPLQQRGGPTLMTLSSLAGPRAVYCGTAVDRASADRVYICAARSLAAKQAFYCRYSPPITSEVFTDAGAVPPRERPAPDVSPAPIGGVWAIASAYVGKSSGVLFDIQRDPYDRRRLVEWPQVGPGVTPRPRSIGAGMTLPALSAPVVADLTNNHRRGMAIVETLIGVDGSVAQTTVVRPLPFGSAEFPRDLVKRAHFEPSRLFGVPVPLIHLITVEVRDGRATVKNPAEIRRP